MSRQNRQQATAAALQQLGQLPQQPQLPQHPLPQPPQPQPPQPNPVVDMDEDMNGQGGSSGPSTSGNPSLPMAGLNLSGTGSKVPFEKVTIRPKEIVCDSLPIEMLTKKGIILQYLNSNPAGATTMVGVTRIGLKDPRRMPAYVERNLSIIRQHAVAALQRHFKLTLCSAGVLETLTSEDYSVSFSWASVSHLGRSLTLHGKPDLALGYAVCEQMVAPVWVSHEDPEPTYVLNVFVQLQEPSRRSTAVIKRAREEDAARQNPSPAKKPNNGNYVVQRVPNSKKQNEELALMIAQGNKVVLEECLKRSAPPSFDVVYPPLPTSEGVKWNTSGTTGLPDD